MKKIFLLFFVITSLFSQKKERGKTVSILFIGNSLTYTNNLPKLVKEYAKLKGISINTKTIAFPNYAIEDHWNDGQVQQLISSKKFDYVIIQQGPSSQSDGRKMLIDYGKKYSELCLQNNVQLCYFMVWTSIRYYYTFNNVIKNHTDAAKINNAKLLPVGKLWKKHIDITNDKKLYSADGFHPSLKGSKFAARIIVDSLFE